jgi:hypothetical protein
LFACPHQTAEVEARNGTTLYDLRAKSLDPTVMLATASSSRDLLEAWAHPPLPQWLASEISARVPSTHVPSTVWMYWDSWPNAPAVIQHCVASWVIMNPTWRVKMISDHTIMSYLPIGWTRAKWDNITVPAHKGDILRLVLLQRWGGVWADATLFCLLPLDGWIFTAIGARNDFFAFAAGKVPPKDSDEYGDGCPGCEPVGMPTPPRAKCLARGGKEFDPRSKRTLNPSVSFLAAAPGSYIASRWAESFASYMLEHMRAPEYTYLHTCFRKLAQSDRRFASAWLEPPEVPSRRVGGAVPLSGRFMNDKTSGNAAPGGPLTSKLQSRIDRVCGPHVKMTYKGHFSQINHTYTPDNSSTVGYLFARTWPYLRSAHRNNHIWPCVYLGADLRPAANDSVASAATRALPVLDAASADGSGTNKTSTNDRVGITWLHDLPLTQHASPSCAIVGSGATLLGRHLGARIEAHQLVVRVNRLAEQASDADLGSRTDVLFSKLSRYDARTHTLVPFATAGSKPIRCPIVASQAPISKCPFRAIVFRYDRSNNTNSLRVMTSLKTAALNSYLSLGLEHPDIYVAVHTIAGTNTSEATTGFHAVHTFRTICGRISLFGFVGNATLDGHRIINHRLDLEHKLLHDMQIHASDGLARVEIV